MDSAFSHLSFLIFAISLSFCALIAKSQNPNPLYSAYSMAAPPPPPPSRFPPDYDGHLVPETTNGRPMRSPPHHHFRHHRHLPPPPPLPRRMNAGQKLGLFFVGIAAIMQVGIVGFLVIKRRQLLKSSDRYETCT